MAEVPRVTYLDAKHASELCNEDHCIRSLWVSG